MTLEERTGDATSLLRSEASPAIARTLAAKLCWLSESSLDPRRNYIVRHTTREVLARVESVDHLWNVATQAKEPAPGALHMNDIGRVAITLAQPVFADRYSDNRATGSFMLIGQATNNTVAAGMIQ